MIHYQLIGYCLSFWINITSCIQECGIEGHSNRICWRWYHDWRRYTSKWWMTAGWRNTLINEITQKIGSSIQADTGINRFNSLLNGVMSWWKTLAPVYTMNKVFQLKWSWTATNHSSGSWPEQTRFILVWHPQEIGIIWQLNPIFTIVTEF